WIIWRATARLARGRPISFREPFASSPRASHNGRGPRSPHATPSPSGAPPPLHRASRSESRVASLSRDALGRDYHKVLRKRLARLAQRIEDEVGPFGYRVFTDNQPVVRVGITRELCT